MNKMHMLIPEYVPAMITLTMENGFKHSIRIDEIATVTQLVGDGPVKAGQMRALVRLSCEMGEEGIVVAESHAEICKHIDAYAKFMMGIPNG